MQNNKYIKLYAAFKAGYMGQNILNTYFPFFANILHEKHIEVIDEYLLQKEFHNKYNFEPTIPFIRQVLSVGLENKSIKKVANNYISDFSDSLLINLTHAYSKELGSGIVFSKSVWLIIK